MKKLMIVCVLMLCSFNTLRAELDTLCTVILKDAIKTDPDSLQFSLFLKNRSDEWRWWANGSFQVQLAYNNDIANIENFEFVKLNEENGSFILPDNIYSHKLLITDNSFLINIVGPKKIDDCIFISRDSTILLGKYCIVAKSHNNFSDSLIWKEPLNIWQSCAYKAKKDSVVGTDLLWFKSNDNIEMTDRHNSTVCEYIIEKTPPPQFILKNFDVKYAGAGISTIQWETLTEAYNQGFSLHKIPSTFMNNSFDESKSLKVTDHLMDSRLVGCKNYYGKQYPMIYDTLAGEGLSFKYLLTYTDYNNEVHRIDSATIFYPRSIISFAQSNPNPFTNQTIINYIAEDDLIINCSVYDLKGKEVLKIFDGEQIKRGEHRIIINSDQLHSSGFYELILIAEPASENSSDQSQVVIPLHLLN
jgi:hypothetical protein